MGCEECERLRAELAAVQLALKRARADAIYFREDRDYAARSCVVLKQELGRAQSKGRGNH